MKQVMMQQQEMTREMMQYMRDTQEMFMQQMRSQRGGAGDA